MKKAATGLLVAWNAVLTAALAFVLLRPEPSAVPAGPHTTPAGGHPSLVYVNTDSLLEHYAFYRDLNDAFKKKQDSIEKVITGRADAMEREIRAYQESAGALSPDQREKEEERLYRNQQALVSFREDLLARLSREESTMTATLHNDLADRMREFNNGRYQFIFGYQQNSGILFAADSLDVTGEVIRELKGR